MIYKNFRESLIDTLHSNCNKSNCWECVGYDKESDSCSKPSFVGALRNESLTVLKELAEEIYWSMTCKSCEDCLYHDGGKDCILCRIEEI